jgi:hypothetical protein
MHVKIYNKDIPVNLKTPRQMKGNHGLFNLEKEEIDLDAKQPVHLRKKTLIHECIHAFFYITGYNELLEEVSPHFEEAMCRGLEQAFESHFVFNDQLEAWISDNLNNYEAKETISAIK